MEHPDIARMESHGELRDEEKQDDYDRIIGTCICGNEIEFGDDHLKIDGEILCDWICGRDWIKLNFEVEENLW